MENVYQRRADLVPNLVETVKGAADFEKDTYTQVAEARSKVGQISGDALKNVLNDPQAFERFQQAQSGLSSALSRLMAVAEAYPDLKANANFRELQSQLEGSENRIAVERKRFNEAAQAFNTKRDELPHHVDRGLLPALRREALLQGGRGRRQGARRSSSRPGERRQSGQRGVRPLTPRPETSRSRRLREVAPALLWCWAEA